MLRAYRYRLYPNHDQKRLLAQHFGCMRWAYNFALERKTRHYQETGKSLSGFDLQKILTQVKKEKATEWLNEVNAQSLQGAIHHLEVAFNAFFRKQNNFPKFKSKHRSNASFSVPQKFKLDEKKRRLTLPKFRKPLKIVLHRPVKGTMKSVVVSMTPSGEYYASILVETGKPCAPKKPVTAKTTLGVDMGIKTFATLSDGRKVDNPRTLQRHGQRLKVLQRRLAKKVKGSKRRNKARINVAKAHEKVARVRKDFLHKLSYQLTHESQVRSIGMETLDIKGMQQRRRLAKSIGDCSWGTFIQFLTYKSDWYGRNFVQIGRFDPSSKMCSACGHIKVDLTLEDREWTCQSCGAVHDRDVNAAINIKKMAVIRGMQQMKLANMPGLDRPVEPVETPVHSQGRRSGKLRENYSREHVTKKETAP